MNKRHFLRAALALCAFSFSVSAFAGSEYVYVYGWVHDYSKDKAEGRGYGANNDKYFVPDKAIARGDADTDEVVRRFKRAVQNSTGITSLSVRWSDAGNDPGVADDHRLTQIDKLRSEGHQVVVVPW